MSLKKQEEFLTKALSRPIICPHCEKTHNVMELYKNYDPSWEVGKTTEAHENNLKCPNTGKGLVHKIGLFAGDEWFEPKVESL